MFHKIGITLIVCSILATVGLTLPSTTTPSGSTYLTPQLYADSLFNVAVEIIKKYEGMHSARHWPYIGYGHGVQKGEPYKRGTVLNESEADTLLRKDLKKFVAMFKAYPDSLLLGVLAYNIGPGNVKKSRVIKMLEGNEEELRASYISHCRYKGKVNSQLQKRRIEEFDTLFPLLRAGIAEEGIIEELDSLRTLLPDTFQVSRDRQEIITDNQ